MEKHEGGNYSSHAEAEEAEIASLQKEGTALELEKLVDEVP